VRRLRSDRGAEAVEFALIAPILILVLVGIVEFGRAYHVQSMLSAAARDGVRVMALEDDTDAARDVTVASASPVAVEGANITVSPTSCQDASTGTIPTAQVVVTYKFEFLAGMLGPDITLTGKGTMRCFG
jgi:Flp pilus assembly protein TadG